MTKIDRDFVFRTILAAVRGASSREPEIIARNVMESIERSHSCFVIVPAACQLVARSTLSFIGAACPEKQRRYAVMMM